MVELAQQYLELRRQLGYSLRGPDRQLLQFARYADCSGHRGPITIELAVRWARLPQMASAQWWARRLQIVRAFAQHRSLFDPCTQIPPAGLLGSFGTRRIPHIYSRTEIRALLAAARQLGPTAGLRPHTYVTLLGLLACTGLRISEALRLTRPDVDLLDGMLTVVLSKFRKSRIVPLHPTTMDALRRYARLRDAYHPQVQADAFFLTEIGTAMSLSGVENTFTRLRRRLGWTKDHEGIQPRIHDLRHTMAVRALLRFYEQGEDVDCKIASLATYLGHVQVTDTYWYLTAIPELMTLVAARFEARYGRCSGSGS
jgi:integrase